MKKSIFFGFILLGTIFLVWLSWPLNFGKNKALMTIYDAQGALLFQENKKQNFAEVSIADFEKWLTSVEDERFRKHFGIDFIGIGRAIRDNIKNKKVVSGASTISMQLGSNLFLNEVSHSWWYKIKQALLAIKLEFQLSKDEILSLYAEKVYLGENIFGFKAGSEQYFGKDFSTLNLAEKAILIGILPFPQEWNPRKNILLANERKNLVLDIWLKKNLISKSENEFWKKQKITLSDWQKNSSIIAPHFVFWLKKKIDSLPAIQNQKEVHIFTPFDKELYQKILLGSQKSLDRKKQKHISNASCIALDEKNNLKAMVGSTNFFDRNIQGQVNMSTAFREVGSILKPFLFALALEKGFSPLDELRDERQSFLTPQGSYAPRNYNPNAEYGRVRFREALAGSYNIASVYLLNQIGSGDFYTFLKKVGIQIQEFPEETGLALILGSGKASLFDMTQAFSIFSHQGKKYPVRFFSHIENEKGDILIQGDDFFESGGNVIKTSTAEWILHALSDKEARWSNFPQGNPLELEFPVAVKTGTSQDFRDNFVIGSSSQYTVGVWVGNTNGTPMLASSGIEGAGPLWQGIMRMLHPRGALPFRFYSERKITSICRAPWESFPHCSKKREEFLLSAEISHNKKPTEKPHLQIAFPSEGDHFHPNSSISIKVRYAKEGPVEFYLDGEKTPPVIPKLSSGHHILKARQGNFSHEINIFVDDH